MKIINVTEVRNNFQDVINRVHYTKEPVIISKRNKPWVMIQPLIEDDRELQEVISRKKGLSKK